MKFITIKSSHYQNDLAVLQSRLESEGIICRLKNEFTSQVLNYLPSFRVELQVPDYSFEEAKTIMKENGETPELGIELVCSSCGSTRIKMKLSMMKRIQLFFALIWVLLINTLPADKLFKNSKYFCKDCGAEM